MRTKATRAAPFAVCVDNTGYDASLEIGKLYRVIPGPEASKHGYIRVVDGSGEDYRYTADRFFELTVPQQVARALGGRSGTYRSGKLQPMTQKARRD